jgi:hypothetical protein
MADKFIKNVSGVLTEQEASTTSAGVADAGKIVALDAAGKLSETMLPTGIGADVAVVNATEALSGGDYVNIWDNSGAFGVRKADASVSGKYAHGFVLDAFAENTAATVYFEGANNQVTGQSPGDVFLSTTPGVGSPTAPSGTGQVVQRIGVATSATSVNFEKGIPVVLA